MKRLDFLASGIFSALIDPDTDFGVFVLEHAYPVASDGILSMSVNYAPKVPPGVYACQRGIHKLKGMAQAFETFEIMNVPDHTGILFHCGNTESDSEGCLLLGLDRAGDIAVLESREAFTAFMKNLEGINEFTLEIL